MPGSIPSRPRSFWWVRLLVADSTVRGSIMPRMSTFSAAATVLGGMWILPRQSMGQVALAMPLRQVLRRQCLDPGMRCLLLASLAVIVVVLLFHS